jgi:hypothetical protein
LPGTYRYNSTPEESDAVVGVGRELPERESSRCDDLGVLGGEELDHGVDRTQSPELETVLGSSAAIGYRYGEAFLQHFVLLKE